MRRAGLPAPRGGCRAATCLRRQPPPLLSFRGSWAMRARGERQSTELLVLQCPLSAVGEAKCRDGTQRSFCLSVTSWASRCAYGPTLQLLQQLYMYTYNMYLFLSPKTWCIPLPPPMTTKQYMFRSQISSSLVHCIYHQKHTIDRYI